MPIVPSLFGLWPYILPVLLLSCSNIFMTFAWYGNLKFQGLDHAVRHFGELGYCLC